MKVSEKETRRIIRALYIKATTTIASDVRDALAKARDTEETELARLNLDTVLRNVEICKKNVAPICSDTGYPVWYIRVGRTALGWFCKPMAALEDVIKEETRLATRKGIIRPTMIDPIDRTNPGTNVGAYIPNLEWKFDDSSDVEITYAPKGGGTEIFLQTFARTLLFADGISGIKKFVLESLIRGNLHGKTCPPNIVGVCIGGTTELCVRLAKEAAVLRAVDDRHPDPRIARLEVELLKAINMTQIGPLGMGGKTTALDVHIEYAYTHLAGFPVGVAIQCPAARISTALITERGIQYKERPDWFGRNQSGDT